MLLHKCSGPYVRLLETFAQHLPYSFSTPPVEILRPVHFQYFKGARVNSLENSRASMVLTCSSTVTTCFKPFTNLVPYFFLMVKRTVATSSVCVSFQYLTQVFAPSFVAELLHGRGASCPPLCPESRHLRGASHSAKQTSTERHSHVPHGLVIICVRLPKKTAHVPCEVHRKKT